MIKLAFTGKTVPLEGISLVAEQLDIEVVLPADAELTVEIREGIFRGGLRSGFGRRGFGRGGGGRPALRGLRRDGGRGNGMAAPAGRQQHRRQQHEQEQAPD